MDNTLHIFSNAKALATFTQSSIKGEVVLFEEKLLEGNISKPLFSDDFWIDRYLFFKENYNLSKLDYFDKTIQIITQLEDVSKYHKVIIWGDYSLKSQINILALFAHLKKYYQKQTNYFLVCSGKHKNKNKWQQLTDYSSKEFSILYTYKVKITLPNLEFVFQSWFVFSTKNKAKITEFNFHLFPSKFQYLQLAIHQFINENF